MSVHSGLKLAGQVHWPPGGGSNAVYVIDDHQDVRQSLDLLLGTFGITTHLFTSAAEFLDRLPSLVPAPLLLDITMPGMNGIALLEALAAHNIKWPVLIMTGLRDAPVVFRAMELGAIGVLEKPFSAEALESALRIALAAMTEFSTAPSRTPFDATR